MAIALMLFLGCRRHSQPRLRELSPLKGCACLQVLCTITLLSFNITFTQAQAVERPVERLSTVADLRYGVVLYEYYQDHYMQALSELLVAEARGGIKGHHENPKIIEGGISLAFGMERKAGELFKQLLNQDQQPQSVRNTAWYYLAKLRYLQGNWQGSAASLASIKGEVDAELSADLKNLQLNLAIRRGALDATKLELKRFDRVDSMLVYHWFNLGNAHSRQGEFTQANESYQTLLSMVDEQFAATAWDDEQRQQVLALYDKALTAAGFSLMSEGEHNAAIEQFSQVRQGSHFSSEALLGFGWAAFQTEEYHLALKPWQRLAQGSMSMPAVQEAQLVVPYVYEQLQNYGAALQGYEVAEQRFESEMSRLQKLAISLQGGAVHELLTVNDSFQGWLTLDQQSYVFTGHEELAQLFSRDRFQVEVQSLQDLLVLQQQLKRWQEKIDIFEWTLQERQNAKAETAGLVEEQSWRHKLTQLNKARNELLQRVERIEVQQDYLAMAQGSITAHWSRVKNMQANMARLSAAGKSIDEYAPVVKLYHGILLWQAAMDFPDTLWRSQQQLRQLNDALIDVRRDQKRFEAALSAVNTVEDSDSPTISLANIDIFKERLSVQSKAVEQALFEADKQLLSQMLEDLKQQQGRLKDYLSQARLAKARLYDTALNELRP